MRDEAQRLVDIFGGEVRHGETLADVAARVLKERNEVRAAGLEVVKVLNALITGARLRQWPYDEVGRLNDARRELAMLVIL